MTPAWIPGPWEVDGGPLSVIKDQPYGTIIIAKLVGDGTPDMEPNANLMAAAPDLYTALNNIRLCDSGKPNPYGHSCGGWCAECCKRSEDEAEAALDKAFPGRRK